MRQTRGWQEASQRGGAHRRPVGDAVVFQLAHRLAVTDGVQGNFGGRAEHILIERVKIQRPVQNMLTDNVRVNFPVAFDNRVGQAQRHRRIIRKFGLLKVTGGIILSRAG